MTWEEVDGVLRSIAKRRAALDVEEARWLRRAEQIELWRRLKRESGLPLRAVLTWRPDGQRPEAELLSAIRAFAM